MNYIEKLKNSILDFTFPRRCIICDNVLTFGNDLESKYLCSECRKRYNEVFDFIKNPTCKKCGAEIKDASNPYCDRCIKKYFTDKNDSYYEYGIGLLRYKESIKESLHKIKYQGRKEYLEFYGRSFARMKKDEFIKMNVECFIPTPIHDKRLNERGYNQAEVLADFISDELKKLNVDIKVEKDFLYRIKNTKVLNKLDNIDRNKEIKDAFFVNKEKNYKRVCLIDDIYTTGSTIESMAKSLKENGVEKVYFAAITIVDNI